MMRALLNHYELTKLGFVLLIIQLTCSSLGLLIQKMTIQKTHQESKYELEETFIYRYIYVREVGLFLIAIGSILRCFIDVMLPLYVVSPFSSVIAVIQMIGEHFIAGNSILEMRFIFILIFIIIGDLLIFIACYNDTDGLFSPQLLLNNIFSVFGISFPVLYCFFCLFLRQYSISTSNSVRKSIFQGQTGYLYLILSSSFFSCYFTLSSKSFLELLKFQFSGGSLQMEGGSLVICYVFLIALFSYWKMNYIGFALAEFHPMLCLPIFHALNICITTLCSFFYFHNDSTYLFINERFSCYIIGLFFVVFGTSLMFLRYDINKYIVVSTNFDDEKTSFLGNDILIKNVDDNNITSVISSTGNTNYYGRPSASLGSNRKAINNISTQIMNDDDII